MQTSPRITFRRLEVFIAIVESGGFGAAAERLGMAQPSVSRHIEALEAQAGGALFQRRRGRGVDLSELGKTFLAHARQLMAEADSMVADLRRSQGEASRRVIFACQRSLSDFLPPVLARFAGDHRDIELITRVGRQEEVIDQIRNASADLGLYLSNHDAPGLKSTVIGQEEMVIVASPHHPLAKQRSIDPAELEKYGFVGAPAGSLIGQATAQLLAGIGVRKMTLVSQATEFEYLRAMSLADVGLYCCFRKRIQPDIDQGRLVALDLDAPPLMMEVRQAVAAAHSASPAVTLFADFLRRQHRWTRRGSTAANKGMAIA
jgi:DNA-binding transcriptional LysR family regulator